jgi:hypothetical protein
LHLRAALSDPVGALAKVKAEVLRAAANDHDRKGTNPYTSVGAWLRERADRIAAALAEHTPACSGPYAQPVDGRSCGPIYCVECSAEAGEWVTWDPEHVAQECGHAPTKGEGRLEVRADAPTAANAKAEAQVELLHKLADEIEPGDHHCFKPWCPHCGFRKDAEWRQRTLRCVECIAAEAERGES